MKADLCAASFDNSDEEAKERESYGGFLTLAFPVDAESGEVSYCYYYFAIDGEGYYSYV